MVRPEANHVLDSHHLDGKVSFVGGRATALVDDRFASHVHADGQRAQVSPRALVCLGLIHAMTIPSGTRLHVRVPFFMATPFFRWPREIAFAPGALGFVRCRKEVQVNRNACQETGIPSIRPIVFLESGLESLVLDADLGGFVRGRFRKGKVMHIKRATPTWLGLRAILRRRHQPSGVPA